MRINYYVYGFSIARVDLDSGKTEIKEHQTNTWKTVDSPQVWKRIQEDGERVEKKDAEKIYQSFHEQIIAKNWTDKSK